MSKVEFVVQWNRGRRFPTGAKADDEFWNGRYYIGQVRITSPAKDRGRVVTYKGHLPTNSGAFALATRAKFSADGKTLEPVLVRKKPAFTWRKLKQGVSLTTHETRFTLDEPLVRMLPQCIVAINALDHDQLLDAHRTLEREPWLLCMWSETKRRWPKLETLPPVSCCEWMKERSVNADKTIMEALKILGHMRGAQAQNGDTLFSGQFWGESVKWLVEKGELHIAERYGLCLTRDFKMTQRLMQALRRICTSEREAVRRPLGEAVPCKPGFPLTEEQHAFAVHVTTHPVTMLNAPPGCGKTEMIVWINTYYRNVLNVTYVGAMVERMQQRLGGHAGISHTIHHVTTSSRLGGDAAREWLAQYDVIVVDEASNVDERLMASLLKSVPNACKLVLIGDLHQIYPIDAGCPFYNLVNSSFGRECTFHLTRNLRVDPAFQLLAAANDHIRNGHVERIEFGLPGRALVQINRGDPKKVLRDAAITARWGSLLDFQLVTMRNDDRRMLNTAMEEVALELGLLKYEHARSPTRLTHALSLFTGKKIMFTKTCKPLVKKAKEYAGVRNGEIALVKHACVLGGGDTLVVTHTGKRVLISRNTQGSLTPSDVDAAYCITCNKSQGSEWQHVLVWMPQNRYPFTREYPYVGFSRARKSCIMVGTKRELVDMCQHRAQPRKTLLERILQEGTLTQEAAQGDEEAEEVPMDYSGVEVAEVGVEGLFPVIVHPEKKEGAKRRKKK